MDEKFCSLEKLNENKILIYIYSSISLIASLILILFILLSIYDGRHSKVDFILYLLFLFFSYMFIISVIGIRKGKRKSFINLLGLHAISLTGNIFSGEIINIIMGLLINGLTIIIGIILLKKLFK
jgi:hypothetical protein